MKSPGNTLKSTAQNIVATSNADILETLTDAVIIIDANWHLIFLNRRAELVFRKKRQDVIDKTFLEVFPDGMGGIYEKCYRKAMEKREVDTIEAFYEPNETWLITKASPLQDGGISLVFQVNTLRKRMEILATSQSRALEMARSGEPLENILNVLILAVEDQAGHKLTASILIMDEDGDHLHHGAAPHLPGTYISAIDGLKIGDNIGSCGTAAYKKEPVIVEDIATDSKWTRFKELALKNGLRACWSIPILSAQNHTVLGTFAVYYPESRTPGESDKYSVEMLSHTAAIVIERYKEMQARNRAEEAVNAVAEKLKKQRRLYETALSNTPDLVYIFDLQGRFTYANEALLKMWGLTWEQAVGKNCLELGYEPWHAEMHGREIKKVIETKKPIRGDVPFTGTHGRRIYDYIFVPVIGDNGEVEAIAGTTRDVTERKEAEEAALKSEERQRLALEASHSFGIWDWDIKNDIFTADERFGTLFGLTSEEAKTGVKLEQVVKSIHEEDIERVRKIIKKKLRSGGRYTEEYRIRQNDGSIRWVSTRGHVQLDENGQAVRFPGVGVDITTERNAIEDLKEANRKKDEFLAILAHELRNPLTPIRNALFLIKSGKSSTDSEKRAYALIARQVDQLVRLVDDLMDVSRITYGKITILNDIHSVEEIINNAVETTQSLIEERKHKLTISLPQEPVYIKGDLVRLSQIFSNLLNNAAKYTEIGGEINIKAEEANKNVMINISDTGIGITVPMLTQIFDMFSQGRSSLEHSQDGLGIGLTLVKRLVELHGGKIKATSEGIGKGSAFSVCLPANVSTKDLQNDIHHEHTYNDQPYHNMKILIVDDNEDVTYSMGLVMEALGHKVEIANDGRNALQIAHSFHPDLVLLDIGLGGMNGYDICMTMKKLPGLEETIFIAQTGWGQNEHLQRSKEVGFDHHLVKPVNIEVLEHILMDIQKNRRSHR
ncbi:PAS domain S-box protein [Nitrosomonas supralitoralis]|uniref:histidine kinase n=1 Tax=Nitrosomonas supralitoralis TaxID=2116706 RepID=A0A2P7NRS3_9PROT|nr:PAS domain S-box protein [Nitrosomonas supralitoralis]PSJ16137.1 ATPase [Nitrosomonas supralitoralis]